MDARVDPSKLPYYGQARSPRYLQRVLETPVGPIAFYNVHPVSPREDFAALRGRGLRRERRGFLGHRRLHRSTRREKR